MTCSIETREQIGDTDFALLSNYAKGTAANKRDAIKVFCRSAGFILLSPLGAIVGVAREIRERTDEWTLVSLKQ